MEYDLVSMQGVVNLARIVDGKPTAMRELGNHVSVNLKITSEVMELYETKTGKRQKINSSTKARNVDIEIVMNEQKQEDVALAFQAEKITIGSETKTDIDIGSLGSGEVKNIDGFKLSSVTIKDGANTALEEGKNYELDAEFGTIKMLDVSGLQMPLKASYTTGEITSASLFSLPDDAEYQLLFKGVNSLDDTKMAVDLWRFKPAVDGSLDLIDDEYGGISLKGSALADIKKQQDPKLGGFGRIVWLD